MICFMEKNDAEPALKFRKSVSFATIQNYDEASGSQQNDSLSQLPDQILALILSFLTVKQAAQTSVLSHRWMYLWRHVPKLNIEDSEAIERIRDSLSKDKIVAKERSCFISWVNLVFEQWLGDDLDEIRITFDLDESCQSDIDKWVDFATVKEVSRLELNFFPALVFYRKGPKCFLPRRYHYPIDFNPALTSLCLKYVNVTTEVIDRLLNSSQVLEKLHIDESELLTSVRASSSSLPLKDLSVSKCPQMQTIDISAPKLLSLTHFGQPIVFNIRNAASLYKVSVGCPRGFIIAYAFEPLSQYFSQLKYLHLKMYISDGINLGIDHLLALTNLKHLELDVISSFDNSILGWIPLLESCPVLEKLTLKLLGFGFPSRALLKCEPCEGRPLNCLKTLEIIPYVGCRLDYVFATYVLEKSVVLEEVIVDVHSSVFNEPIEDALLRARNLERKLPKGAKLIIK